MGKRTYNLSLEKRDYERLCAIVNDPRTIFETKSHAARECLRHGLNFFENEVNRQT